MTQARADMLWSSSARVHGEDAVYYPAGEFENVPGSPVRVVVMQENPVISGGVGPFGGLSVGGYVRCHVDDLTPAKGGAFYLASGVQWEVRDEPRLIKPQNRVWECYCVVGDG